MKKLNLLIYNDYRSPLDSYPAFEVSDNRYRVYNHKSNKWRTFKSEEFAFDAYYKLLSSVKSI